MDNPNPAPPAINPPAAAGEDKTVAIIAYLTLIGFIAAAIINSGKKTKRGAYGCLVWPCAVFFGVAMFVFWILGLVAAINGEMKPMPMVGPLYQKWFGTTFD